MPAKSKAQFRFMKAMENDPEQALEKGISPKVAKEFTDKITKKRFAKLKEKMSKEK